MTRQILRVPSNTPPWSGNPFGLFRGAERFPRQPPRPPTPTPSLPHPPPRRSLLVLVISWFFAKLYYTGDSQDKQFMTFWQMALPLWTFLYFCTILGHMLSAISPTLEVCAECGWVGGSVGRLVWISCVLVACGCPWVLCCVGLHQDLQTGKRISAATVLTRWNNGFDTTTTQFRKKKVKIKRIRWVSIKWSNKNADARTPPGCAKRPTAKPLF